jgi:hypothetical protein
VWQRCEILALPFLSAKPSESGMFSRVLIV